MIGFRKTHKYSDNAYAGLMSTAEAWLECLKNRTNDDTESIAEVDAAQPNVKRSFVERGGIDAAQPYIKRIFTEKGGTNNSAEVDAVA